MTKNLDEKVEKLEAAVDPNTVISVGGINFTPAKLMIAGTIISTVLGGLYGAFEVYKDYMSMKEAIQNYVAPDLSELNKKIEVLTTKSDQSFDYTKEINTTLKADIRRLEGVVDSVERGAKQTQRETQQDVNEVRKELKQLNKEVDAKIKKALDNPLAQ
jgi:peptidoglycan hydrolase CwlO-like protein